MANFVILQEYIPRYRGPFFELLSEDLGAHGHHLTIGAGAPSKSLLARGDAVASNVAQIVVSTKHFTVLGRRIAFRRAKRALRGADYVIVEHARRNIDVYRLFLPRRFRSHPVALWGHGRDYVTESKGIERRLFKMLAGRADWYFAYTSEGKRYLVSQCGLEADRITVVQNSLDSKNLRELREAVSEQQRADFKKSVGASGPIVVHLGALDPAKRIEFMLSAAVDLRELVPDCTVVFIGDGILREQVKQAAARYPWIQWLGAVSEAEKAIALSAATAIAIPGRVGLVVIDSFATEVPIVTVSHDRHAPEFEYLTHGDNCLIVDNELSSFTGALADLVDNESLARKLKAGCARAFEQYSLPAMVANFVGGLLLWHDKNSKPGSTVI